MPLFHRRKSPVYTIESRKFYEFSTALGLVGQGAFMDLAGFLQGLAGELSELALSDPIHAPAAREVVVCWNGEGAHPGLIPWLEGVVAPYWKDVRQAHDQNNHDSQDILEFPEAVIKEIQNPVIASLLAETLSRWLWLREPVREAYAVLDAEALLPKVQKEMASDSLAHKALEILLDPNALLAYFDPPAQGKGR